MKNKRYLRMMEIQNVLDTKIRFIKKNKKINMKNMHLKKNCKKRTY